MKTKPADIPYCSVNEKRIKEANPILHKKNTELLFHWIKERYQIHTKKDVEKKSSPWTDDPILKNYRFTNVRREHDKETQWLITNIANNDCLSLEEKILNTILFRTWNKSSTMQAYGGPWWKEELKLGPLYFKSRVDIANLSKPFTPVFSTSFIKEIWRFSDGKGDVKYKIQERELPKGVDAIHDSVPLRMFYIPVWVLKNNILPNILNSTSQANCNYYIRKIPGFGEFLAYQVFVDLTYIQDFKYSENEFTIAGPGAKRGLDRVFLDKDGMNYEECLFWLRDNQEQFLEKYNIDLKELMYDLPEEDCTLTVMNLENSMCELSKYLKTYYNEGRPRQKYITKGNTLF